MLLVDIIVLREKKLIFDPNIIQMIGSISIILF